MKVLVVRPMELPAVQEIDHTLSAMQELVGGTIQAVYPFDDPVALIANDEGKLLGLPLNRALRDEEGEIYDVIAGTFFICGAPPDSESFASLADEQMDYWMERFAKPEFFVRVNGKVICVPVEEPGQ